jgi:hypothetical protein
MEIQATAPSTQAPNSGQSGTFDLVGTGAAEGMPQVIKRNRHARNHLPHSSHINQPA